MPRYKIVLTEGGLCVSETERLGTKRDIARSVTSVASSHFTDFNFNRETLTATDTRSDRSVVATEIVPEATGRQGKETLGKRVRKARLDRGWTMAVVSKKTGLHVPTIARIEHDQQYPHPTTIAALERALSSKLRD